MKLITKISRINRIEFKKAIFVFLISIISLGRIFAQEATVGPAPKEKKLVEAPSANSNVQQGPAVKDIQIEYVGPKSVNRSVILSNMRTTIGQPYSPAAVEEDIRNLYATGFFTNLRITDEPLGDGVKVVVIVQPKPLVKEIVVNGPKKLEEKRIRKEIKSKVGDALSEQQVSEDSDKIKELYRNKGFSRAEITYKIDINEEFGRAVITFSINESSKGFVTKINFIGNKNLTTEELQKVLKTKEKDWLTWFTKSGVIKEEQFKDDKQKLKDYYQGKGYIDMEIKDVKYDYPNENEIHLTVTLFEGIQYHVGTVGFKGNVLFNAAQIKSRLKMLDAGVYSPQGMEADKKAIQDLYGEKGYIDANINPERQANVESGKIDLIYSVSEGPQSYVDKIVVQGNNKTKDKVLRREVALAPGDVYDSVRGDASKKRLENLGYFEKVDISSQDTNIPNRKNMVVTVEEKRTGSVTFGAGFSSVESLLGFVEFQQGNFDIANFPYFTGAGQKFRARVQYGLKRKDLLLSFTEPWFMNQRLSLGFDIFASQKEFLSSLYNQQNIGSAVRLAKPLDAFWTASMKYQVENIKIYDMDSNVSTDLAREAGSRSKSAVTFALTYDTRDNVFLTRKGERLEFSTELAGGPLYGETQIHKVSVDAQKWFLLPWDIIFSVNGSTGVVDRYGDTEFVPIFDRYFVGGSRSVRGFDYRDVGPRDNKNEPSGGKTYGYMNYEMTFPIIDRVRFAVFTDIGFADASYFDYGDLWKDVQIGSGLGLRLNLPIGPLRLDFGVPVKATKENESSGKFHFDVGYQF